MAAKPIDWTKVKERLERLAWCFNDVAFKPPENQADSTNGFVRAVMALADEIHYGPTKEERDLVIAALTNTDVRLMLVRLGHKDEHSDSLLEKMGAG
jgi:hypothetical protein